MAMADVGRPLIFSTPNELQKYISAFFQEETGRITISGLAYYLGFESRQSFYDYEKRPEFSYTIKRARLFIENEYEKLLISNNTTGAIFALKNFGWSDKQEIQHSGEINIPPIKWAKSDEQPGD